MTTLAPELKSLDSGQKITLHLSSGHSFKGGLGKWSWDSGALLLHIGNDTVLTVSIDAIVAFTATYE